MEYIRWTSMQPISGEPDEQLYGIVRVHLNPKMCMQYIKGLSCKNSRTEASFNLWQH